MELQLTQPVTMERDRPRLTDPAEFAIIRSIYMKDQLPQPGEDTANDQAERYDRMQHKTNRNQSR